jgi:hypothetical protein
MTVKPKVMDVRVDFGSMSTSLIGRSAQANRLAFAVIQTEIGQDSSTLLHRSRLGRQGIGGGGLPRAGRGSFVSTSPNHWPSLAPNRLVSARPNPVATSSSTRSTVIRLSNSEPGRFNDIRL